MYLTKPMALGKCGRMNKYKVAETIVTNILSDLKNRIDSGTKWDVDDEEVKQDITDKWEDIVISELERQEHRAAESR